MPATPMRSLVSIITPTYNHAPFIRACIDSVVAQKYSNWEQIVIDDGSTDETVQIVSSYRDDRIRCEIQKNQGPFSLATTYNRALSMARGNLIAILEGDDFWPANKLSTLVPAFVDEGIVLAYGEAADVGVDGRTQARASRSTRIRTQLPSSILANDPIGAATRHMLTAEGRSLISPSTVIIRREALDQIGGFQFVEGLPLTDYPTFIQLSLAGEFHYCPQVMGYRRRHERSVTVNHTQTIHEMVSNFTLQFMETRKDEILLSQEEWKEVLASWQEAEDKLHFSDGRSLLLRGKWAEARYHFRAASKSKRASVQLSAYVGFLCSCLHIDIELLMRLGGRAKLRSAKAAQTDQGVSI